MRIHSTILIALVFLSHPASSSEYLRHFLLGNFEEARDIGRKDRSAEGLTIACRASLVIGGFQKSDSRATENLHAAIDDCLLAYELDPTYFDAQVSLAIALSFEGKRKKRVFHPKQAKALLENLVERYPESAISYGALAAWHAQVSAAGFLARMALGASRKKAALLFDTAFDKGVIDFPLKFEYLKFLSLGSKKERQKATLYAKQLIAEKVGSYFDELLQKRAEQLHVALLTNKKKTIKNAVKEASAFSNAEDWKKAPAYPKAKLMEWLGQT